MTHVAVFTWEPGTSDDEIRALHDGLAALPGLRLITPIVATRHAVQFVEPAEMAG